MSFNSRFKHIFGEIFQSEGFKYCSKLNVFAKMLNEDLLAFIGVKSAPIWNKGSKGFMITAGIISTYYDSIEKNSVLMIGHDLNLFLPKNEVRVFDFNSYIEYLKKYSIDLLWNCDSFKGESLILIKADNHDDFQKFFQQQLDELCARIDAGDVGDGYTKEMAYNDLFHGIIESIVYPRDKVYFDKDLYHEALKEAERRKNENMRKLYSYKLL